MALRLLDLDEVWWLVSPQNPLKSRRGMAPLSHRLKAACQMARHPRIVVTDMERQLGTFYTIDTLTALRLRYSNTRFVWLMGADNLIQIRQWRRWQKIFYIVPVAVFDRPPYSCKAGASLAARRMARWRRDRGEAKSLLRADLPAWTFFHTPLRDVSSTELRDKGFWPYQP